MDAADATTITIDASKVSGWNDKSGFNYHFTQTTAAYRPTYSNNSQNSKSTISFSSSSSNYLLGNSTATGFAIGTNSYALFAVFKIISGAGGIYNKSLYGTGQGRILCVKETSNTLNCCFIHDTSGISAVTNTSTSYQIVSLVINKKTANNDTLYVNGISQGTTYSYSADTFNYPATTNVMLVGAYNNSAGTGPHTSYYLNGNIAEIVSYSNAYDMSISTRQTVEGYLAQKWGIN